MAIRIMVVDGQAYVRSWLKGVLEEQTDFQVVGEACDGQSALKCAAECTPEVIIMDITTPEMDGLRVTRLLREHHPGASVLAVSAHADQSYFLAMLLAGASGYMTKAAVPGEVVDAVRSVATGFVYLQPACAQWLLEEYRRLSAQATVLEADESDADELYPGVELLSERELQVIRGVALGLASPEIGEKLGISRKTVSRHRERIMSKLNIHSSAELVKFAIRSGIVEV